MKDVHTEHCCAIHGCKYGKDDECTVVTQAKERKYVQSFPCESCCDDGLDTLEKVLKSIHPTMGTFANHIILYAKHWYGNSYNGTKDSKHIISDIRKLQARYCWVDEEYISDMEVQNSILDTFNKYVTSEHDRSEGLQEMLGWKWGRNDGVLSDREPEVVMIGKLAIVDGNYVFMDERYEDVCLDRDNGKDCKKCHRFSIEKGVWNECKCKTLDIT